jgi:amino-acid N-acetyltransferase
MIRKAQIRDIPSIHALLGHYGQRGELLPRPLSELYDHLRDFAVCEAGGPETIVGCCALQFCWEDLAEIRSLAVQPQHAGQGFGTRLVEWALAEARDFSIRRVFTLTYRPSFFQRFGFDPIERCELPLVKIWAGCLQCVKFPNCDETALAKTL